MTRLDAIMRLVLHEDGKRYAIEAPDGARVNRLPSGDCLIYRHEGKDQYILTDLVVTVARQGKRGLRLVEEVVEVPR